MTETIRIQKAHARRLILACQGLHPPRMLKGKKGAKEYLTRVRSIQFDPINVVGRNPDLVLQSRVKDYRPADLDELLYQDRWLIDVWDKMASLSVIEDWPFFARHRARMQDIFGVPAEVVMELAPVVLKQIREEGPQSSLDFKHTQKTDWAWGPTRVSRAALEGLFKMGQLGVHHRINNRRYFDLIEKLLPADLLSRDDPNASLEDYQAWHVSRRIRGLGLAHPNAGEQWGGMIGVKSPQRRKIIDQLHQRGDLIAIEIEELPGETFYISREDLDLLEGVKKPYPAGAAAFIAPLDNLLWDRKTVDKLFDFQYVWEVYKPEKDRQYGYYVLPVLYRDRLVARLDPAYDKTTGLLTIQNWWWEEGFLPDEDCSNALADCLGDFMKYLGAGELKCPRGLVQRKGMAWLKSI